MIRPRELFVVSIGMLYFLFAVSYTYAYVLDGVAPRAKMNQ
jgi:5'-3' exonuclease